uniref:ATP synthase subunit a n=2 Tax=Phrynocephalus TaxID=52205 RepID=A0A6C0WXC3_9SAUR|nr:ATP synthase F0 subunit 6 [Phrynocephalus nasatus]QIC50535.1 ATP synthase F0 subunit 6 [Phrynocephalus forsythii]QQO99803.1 ATP synthase F0 subunit 6 [Phrynocephalus nasatus]
MMTNLFNQFEIPQMFGTKMTLITLLLPLMLTPQPTNRLSTNRTYTLTKWMLKEITKHLMLPTSKNGFKWAPLLTSLLLMLLTLNIVGMFPYTFTPTTQLSVNMALALPLWLATVLIGLRTQPTKSMAHLLPEGTPTLLIPTLIVIESISLLIRPIALGVRLTANLTAGHLLLQLISTAALSTVKMIPTLSLLPTVLLILLMVLEFAVAIIQAYVFTLLTCLYLQENT